MVDRPPSFGTDKVPHVLLQRLIVCVYIYIYIWGCLLFVEPFLVVSKETKGPRYAHFGIVSFVTLGTIGVLFRLVRLKIHGFHWFTSFFAPGLFYQKDT